MQPGYPGPGQDPYGQQQPQYQDPYSQPQYGQQPYADPYAQPQQYQDPYGQQPTSGSPYPSSPSGYPPPGSQPGYPQTGYPQPGYPQPGYPQPGYPQPGYEQQYPVAGYGVPQRPTGQSNTMGILALVFGILAIPAGLCCSLLALLPGGAGVALGMVGMKRANEGQATNRGMALAGVICGAIGAVIGIALFILSLVFNFNAFRYP